MIQTRTMLKVADNTGAKKIQCIKIFGGYKKRYGRIGDIITAVVKLAEPHMLVHKSDIVHAVIVRVSKETKRPDGSYIRFDDNAAVIIDKTSKEPKGSMIFGPVGRELRNRGFLKIISLADEVI